MCFRPSSRLACSRTLSTRPDRGGNIATVGLVPSRLTNSILFWYRLIVANVSFHNFCRLVWEYLVRVHALLKQWTISYDYCFFFSFFPSVMSIRSCKHYIFAILSVSSSSMLRINLIHMCCQPTRYYPRPQLPLILAPRVLESLRQLK